MRFTFQLLLFTTFITFIAGCSTSTQNEKKRVSRPRLHATPSGSTAIPSMHLSLLVPPGMHATRTLDELAPLQYENRNQEYYFIGFYETRNAAEEALAILHFNQPNQSLGSNYVDFTLDQMLEGVEVSGPVSRKMKKNQGNDYFEIQLDGKVQGVSFPISYFITIITTEERLYKFVSWTLQSKKKSFELINQQLIGSLRFD
jgi:hypothetical protein